ncbi:MAG: hypothetical protein GTO14_19910 [Anaerolineales bacterium]|nr:hypothetical protein [Anaerolineales bacterium]
MLTRRDHFTDGGLRVRLEAEEKHEEEKIAFFKFFSYEGFYWDEGFSIKKPSGFPTKLSDPMSGRKKGAAHLNAVTAKQECGMVAQCERFFIAQTVGYSFFL